MPGPTGQGCPVCSTSGPPSLSFSTVRPAASSPPRANATLLARQPAVRLAMWRKRSIAPSPRREAARYRGEPGRSRPAEAYAGAWRFRDPSGDAIRHRSGIFYNDEPLAACQAFLFPGEVTVPGHVASSVCISPRSARPSTSPTRSSGGESHRSRLGHIVGEPLEPGGWCPPRPPLWRIMGQQPGVSAADMAIMSLLQRARSNPMPRPATAAASSPPYAGGAVAVRDEDHLMELQLRRCKRCTRRWRTRSLQLRC